MSVLENCTLLFIYLFFVFMGSFGGIFDIHSTDFSIEIETQKLHLFRLFLFCPQEIFKKDFNHIVILFKHLKLFCVTIFK